MNKKKKTPMKERMKAYLFQNDGMVVLWVTMPRHRSRAHLILSSVYYDSLSLAYILVDRLL